MRALNASSSSPPSGRYCHWLRNKAVSFRNPAMSSIGKPFTIRAPVNGGTKISLVSSTSGDRDG